MPLPFQVVISSGGIYHAYHSARGAANAGLLKQFIVGIYNKREQGIPIDHFYTIGVPEYIGKAIQHIPGANSQYLSYLIRDNLFDALASRVLQPSNIFHGWNHMSLYTMRQAKKLGAKTFIERSSAHPAIQLALLKEEFERFGLSWPYCADWLVAKHTQEYEVADFIFVCSEFVKRTMMAEGIPESKLCLVDLGFDADRFFPGEKSDDVFRVVFAGMISLQKGVHYLLEAFKRLRLPNSELVLVGGRGPDARYFLPEYEGIYRHIPFVPQHKLPIQFHQASVFVLPSLQDGFGMVVYEAAACGIPVIITENVGARIRHEQDGFIVPIRDADALAARLFQLYEDENLRRTMGKEAQAFVQQFTWEHYHRQLIRHYQDALDM